MRAVHAIAGCLALLLSGSVAVAEPVAATASPKLSPTAAPTKTEEAAIPVELKGERVTPATFHSKPPPAGTPERAGVGPEGVNLLHYLSYDSSEHRSEAEGSSPDPVGYGTGLDLSNTEVADKDLTQLSAPAFEKVKWLNLRGTEISDVGLAHIQHLKALKTLILEGTKVTGATFNHLRSLPIETLILEDTKFSNEGLKSLAGSGVQTLNLTLTRITDDGLQYLERLPKLKSLSLYSTEITDEGLLFIYDLHLEKLFLTGTQVTETEVERLRYKLPDLVVIY